MASVVPPKVQTLTREQRQTNNDQRSRGGVILMNENGCILLLKDRTHGKWSFPKGAMEPCDATVFETAIRECQEEAGLVAGVDYLLTPAGAFRQYNNYYFFGVTTRPDLEVTPQDDEIADYEWVNPLAHAIPDGELNSPVRSFLKRYF